MTIVHDWTITMGSQAMGNDEVGCVPVCVQCDDNGYDHDYDYA